MVFSFMQTNFAFLRKAEFSSNQQRMEKGISTHPDEFRST